MAERDLRFDHDRLAHFAWVCRERYRIRLRKERGDPPPWTTNQILATYHFCNVHRVHDRTTQVLHNLMREQNDPLDQLRAAILGRFTNRPQTIRPAWEALRRGDDMVPVLKQHGLNVFAFKIHTPLGLSNHAGVAKLMATNFRPVHDKLRLVPDMQAAINCLKKMVHSVGNFNGYQLALDLWQTDYWGPRFDHAWAFPGPGAGRGSLYLYGEDVDYTWTRMQGRPEYRPDLDKAIHPWLQRYMRALADRMMRDEWPADWLPFTIHEAEFMLCEYDKYQRKAHGNLHGRKYKPG